MAVATLLGTSGSDQAQRASLVDLVRDRPGKHIMSVGFELEGGINKSALRALQRHAAANRLDNHYSYGEERNIRVRSRSISNVEIRLWSDRFHMLADFLGFAYNECGFATNDTCGFHVHMKFGDMAGAASLFSSPSVNREFLDLYSQKFPDAKYQDRIYNSHCSAGNVGPERYIEDYKLICFYKNSAVNIGAYRSNGTIEFRILPHQESAEEAVESLDWIVKTADLLYSQHHGTVTDALVSPYQVEKDRMTILELSIDHIRVGGYRRITHGPEDYC
jgi:hypothetical protein